LGTKYIFHQEELEGYAPPAHSGVTNVRLVEKDKVDSRFEMILGSVMPGGGAQPHYHEKAFQVYYILEGEGQVKIGENPVESFRPGSVIIIPPKMEHSIWANEGQPAKGIVIYTPPLEENGFKIKK